MLDSQKRAAAGVVGRRLELREAACRRKRAMSSAANKVLVVSLQLTILSKGNLAPRRCSLPLMRIESSQALRGFKRYECQMMRTSIGGSRKSGRVNPSLATGFEPGFISKGEGFSRDPVFFSLRT